MTNHIKSAAPKFPEGSSWERLDLAFRKVLTVSKEALLKAEEKDKPQNKKAKNRAKKRDWQA